MSFLLDVLFPFILGLHFFLLGLYAMRIGFYHLAGKKMEAVVTRFTRTPLHSFGSGVVSTFVLQSSTAVTVLTIGLTQAGAISFAQTVGIILGTNIGSTVTTELVALHLEDFAVPMLLIGAALWLQPRRLLRCTGLVVAGFGLLFLGVDTMQVIAKPLEQSETFRKLFLESSHSIWIGLLAGTLFAALVHSSAATTMIAMGLTAHNVMTIDAALAVVLGANIGTCFTALLASIGTNRASQRVAWCHTLFNVAGALVFLPLLPSLAHVVRFLTHDSMMQIAHAQTIYNVVCSLVALPFAYQIAQGMEWLIPDTNTRKTRP